MNLKLGIVLAATIAAAHSQTGVPASRTTFDVASIRPNTSGDSGFSIRPIVAGRLSATNVPVNHLIKLAYEVQDFQISGAPSWTTSDRFDITAESEGMESARFAQMRRLLQSLLTDRFRLVLHRETKEAPAYDLVAAKGGPKLVATKNGSCTIFDSKSPLPPQPDGALPRVCGFTRMGRNLYQAFGISMADLARDLGKTLGRTVVDKTDVTGTFDVHLAFAPDDAIAPEGLAAPTADLTGPSIFTAIQEQLGLRLKSSKSPVQVLVIDHVERPSEN